MADLIVHTEAGLYCPAGDFHIDPRGAVSTAVITHAHGDHARSGHQRYLSARDSLPLLHRRYGDDLAIEGLEYGETRTLGDVAVSLHPAGHILGSAQVRIDDGSQVWVVSGDYKLAPDPTCPGFEPVPCDVFVTEATFALPIYRWPETPDVARDIAAWLERNRVRGLTTVLFCYALGKAQRLMAELASHLEGPIYLHGAMVPLVEVYREQGVLLPETVPVSERPRKDALAGELVLAPPSAAGSPWMKRFRKHATGFASGWMRVRGNRRRRGYDRGFVVSDHADWPGLIEAIRRSQARRILCMHGRTDVLVRYVQESLGLDAAPLGEGSVL